MVRGFFNVCRHHAAAVVTDPEGSRPASAVPTTDGPTRSRAQLKGTPDFAGVCDFDRSANGLVPVETAPWEKWIFARPERGPSRSTNFSAPISSSRMHRLGLGALSWMERRHYTLDCNWKVFVDNYLDGGYHVPHLHKGLHSVLDYSTLHHRERRPLLPAVQPHRQRRRRAREPARCGRAIARSTTGSIRTS